MRTVRLDQQTPAWLNWRLAGIGASDATILSGCPVPWPDPTTPRDLWLLKTGQATAPESTFAQRRGSRLEGPARDLYQRHTGNAVRPVCVEHDQYPWLRASLDGLDAWGDLVVEIKAPRRESHADALAGHVPDYYVPQVQHQLYVTGSSLLHYWSYSENKAFGPGERTALVEVRPDPDYQRRLLLAEWEFWGRVVARLWPGEDAAPGAAPGLLAAAR